MSDRVRKKVLRLFYLAGALSVTLILKRAGPAPKEACNAINSYRCVIDCAGVCIEQSHKAPATPEKLPSNRAARVSMQRKHPTDHARRWLQSTAATYAWAAPDGVRSLHRLRNSSADLGPANRL